MKNKKRILNLFFVVIGAVVLGVSLTVFISVQQIRDPVMRQLITQQTQILNLQKKMDRQLSQRGIAAGTEGEGQRRKPLEQRIASLEKKIEGLVSVVGNLQKGLPRRQGPPPEEYTKVHKIDVAHSPVRGNTKAQITIVEFVDFQCPFCSRFHPVLDDVLMAYPQDVNYIIKNFPLSFHKQAKPAAKAAFAAGEQGRYWEMADLLLKNNKELSEKKFEKWAKNLGLNVKKFKADYKKKDKEWEKLILADMQLGQKVQVRGTPTFYLNGRKTRARDLATFKKEIDKILNDKK